jgi:FtsH-binding integral membrane protein
MQALGFSDAQVAEENAAFIRKVYLFMAAGLGATALAALAVASNATLNRLILKTPFLYLALILVELVMVASFSWLARRLSAVGAGLLFFSYAIMNGLTLSVIFLVFTRSSIAAAFFTTAGTFGVMSVYGYTTRRDLTSVGNFMFMGLCGIVLASLVNIFLRSPAIYWVTTFAGVLVFVGLTAYDTQKIVRLNVIGNAGTDEDHKEAIHGALVLYLDFINLFLYLLRLFGRRRD